jgi:hypothetical protein
MGVLHRDVKPDNLLVSGYGDVKLADFGIAAVVEGASSRTSNVTASIAHAAPEVLEGKRPAVTSDVYGIASAVFALLYGRAAFRRSTDESVLPMMNRIFNDAVPDLRQHGIPAAVCDVLERAMAKDPANRYATAEAFGAALQDAQRATGVAVAPMVIDATVVAPPVDFVSAPAAPAAPAVPAAAGVTADAPGAAGVAPVGVTTTSTGELDEGRSGPSRRVLAVLGVAAVLALAFGAVALAMGGGGGDGGDGAVVAEERGALGRRSEPTEKATTTTTKAKKKTKTTQPTTATTAAIAPATPTTRPPTRSTQPPQTAAPNTVPATPPPTQPPPPLPTVSLSGPSGVQGTSDGSYTYNWTVNATNAVRGTWALTGVTLSAPNWTPSSQGFYWRPSCAQAGSHTLTLTVYSASGQSARASKSITVNPC